MKHTLLAIALVSTAFALPAVAGGPTDPADDSAPAADPAVPDWQGFYAGVAYSKPSGSVEWFSEIVGGGFTDGADWEDSQGVLALGYNLQRGNMVYGLELNHSSGNFTATDTADNGYFNCGSFDGCITEISKLTELRGRIGRAFGPNLIYLSAGAARAEVTGSVGFLLGALGTDSLSGYSVGLGIEHAVSKRMTLRAQYLHIDLGTLDLPEHCFVCSTEVRIDTLRLGVNFRF